MIASTVNCNVSFRKRVGAEVVINLINIVQTTATGFPRIGRKIPVDALWFYLIFSQPRFIHLFQALNVTWVEAKFDDKGLRHVLKRFLWDVRERNRNRFTQDLRTAVVEWVFLQLSDSYGGFSCSSEIWDLNTIDT